MLSLIISSAAQAFAQSADAAAATPQQGGMQLFLIMGGFIFIFYFLLIRPQKKQQKERQNMLDNIKRGDQIQTNGGIFATVTAVDQKELTIRIAPDVRVKLARSGVAGVIKQGPADSSPAKAKTDISDSGSSQSKDKTDLGKEKTDFTKPD
jgi:preprotein translocase subunit YajC